MSVRRYSSTRANIFGDRSTNGRPRSSRASGWRPENMAASIDCGCFTSVERKVQKTVPPTFSSTSTCSGLAAAGADDAAAGAAAAAEADRAARPAAASRAATRRSGGTVRGRAHDAGAAPLTQAGHEARSVHWPGIRSPQTIQRFGDCAAGFGWTGAAREAVGATAARQ